MRPQVSVWRITATFHKGKTHAEKKGGRASGSGAEPSGAAAGAAAGLPRARPGPAMPPRSCASAPCTAASPSPPLTYIYLAKRTRKVRDPSAFRKLIRRKLPFWSGDNTEKVPKRTPPHSLPGAGPERRTRGDARSAGPLVPLIHISAEPAAAALGTGRQKSRKVPSTSKIPGGSFRRRAGGEWKPGRGKWMKLSFSIQALRGLI